MIRSNRSSMRQSTAVDLVRILSSSMYRLSLKPRVRSISGDPNALPVYILTEMSPGSEGATGPKEPELSRGVWGPSGLERRVRRSRSCPGGFGAPQDLSDGSEGAGAVQEGLGPLWT